MNFDVVCKQMKWLICIKLASCVRMRAPILPPAPYFVSSGNNIIDAVDVQLDDQPSQFGELGTTDKLLLEIRDLLRTKIRRKAEQRKKAEDEEDKKKDWKFAADVIDRVLLIIFTILFVTGTLIFSVTAAVVYRSYV